MKNKRINNLRNNNSTQSNKCNYTNTRKKSIVNNLKEDKIVYLYYVYKDGINPWFTNNLKNELVKLNTRKKLIKVKTSKLK